ncbi:hypothetical protein BJ742DRAFT_682873 [Cladochytrium replicatum]|nr:hypothetical protein BJ742DRAFT_682873 [Cladochytrium replicatum]
MANQREDVALGLIPCFYQELNTPQIDFPIRQVQLNGTGRLLAVAGDHDVSVVVVPTYLGRPSGPGRSVSECKYCRIGEYIHSTDRVTRIAKIAWHPLSENQSHLVVLSSDGALRMYNVVLMPDEPEFEYFTVPPARASRASMLGTSYGLGFEEREAISFSLGSCGGGLPGTNLADSDAGQGMGEVGWGPFTIYVLMKNGDVYCVCPVMPNRSLLDMRFLEQLRKINTYEWSAMEHEHLPASSSRSHNEDTPQQQLSNQYYWRNRFLTEIIEMANLPESRFSNKTFAPSSPLPSRRSGMVSAYPPRSVAKLGVKRQGPYLVHPAPDDEDEIACDLVCVYSKPVHLLVVGYEGGVLRVLVEVDPPVPMWDLSVNGEQGKVGYTRYVPLFLKLTILCVSRHSTQRSKPNRSVGSVLLVTDPKYVDVLYSYSDRGAYRIDVGPAVSDLVKGAKEPKGSDVRSIEILIGTSLNLFDYSDGENQSAAAVTGLALITDMFLGYTQLTLTSNNRIFGNPLPLRIRDASSASSGAVLETAPAADASSSAQSADSEQRILKTAFAEPEILRKGLPTLPKIVAQGGAAGVYPNFVTEEALRVFGKRVMLLRENAQQLINAGMLMSKHVTTQQSELARQALVMQRAHERLETHVTSRGDSLKERLERVVATQKRLSSRSDTVLQILLDLSTPSLSTAEVKWIEEVEGLEKVANERFKPLIAQVNKKRNRCFWTITEPLEIANETTPNTAKG